MRHIILEVHRAYWTRMMMKTNIASNLCGQFKIFQVKVTVVIGIIEKIGGRAIRKHLYCHLFTLEIRWSFPYGFIIRQREREIDRGYYSTELIIDMIELKHRRPNELKYDPFRAFINRSEIWQSDSARGGLSNDDPLPTLNIIFTTQNSVEKNIPKRKMECKMKMTSADRSFSNQIFRSY